MRALMPWPSIAPNGLRRGYTTGSCATAGVVAALHFLCRRQTLTQVEIDLPDPAWRLSIPIFGLQPQGRGVMVTVRKDAGDDQDATANALIVVRVQRNTLGRVRFFAGQGVGTVTQSGLRIGVGEPAINPTPRHMMLAAVASLAEAGAGFDIEVGCVGGERIAQKTFNPRLGIVGGISILGTSGLVEPLSQAAWMASIEVYIRVAIGAVAPPAIAFTPGKIGQPFAQTTLGLSRAQTVHIANFMGAALDDLNRYLTEIDQRLGRLWVLGHPAKLAKILDGAWDTHSSQSAMAMPVLAKHGAQWGWPEATVTAMAAANTVEGVIQGLRTTESPAAVAAFWRDIEATLAALLQTRLPRVDDIQVRLFQMDGTLLGEDSTCTGN